MLRSTAGIIQAGVAVPSGTRRAVLAALLICVLSVLSAGSLLAQARPVEGLWGSVPTTPDHPSWRMEDQVLFSAAPRVAYEYLHALLSDPENDTRSLSDLAAEARQAALGHVQQLLLAAPSRPQDSIDPSEDPRVQCEPLTLPLIINGPRPFSIAVEGDYVVLHHEEENTIRRIPLGQRFAMDTPPSRMGTPIARFEGDTLVVETSRIVPIVLPFAGLSTEALRIVERYRPDEDDPNRLELETILDDPGTFREPLVSLSPRVRIEGQIFVDEACEVMYEEDGQ
jgi:hypothetical protein